MNSNAILEGYLLLANFRYLAIVSFAIGGFYQFLNPLVPSVH